MPGWIKLHRSLQKWEWWHDDKMLRVFLTILLNANHEPGRWQGQDVKRGQWITGRKSLAQMTGYTERQIRTILKRLVTSQELTIQTTNRFSIITVIKWDSYQLDEAQNDQPDANKRPASDQQVTTNKNEENEKNEKEVKPKPVAKRFAPPTLDQVQEYCKERNNTVDPERWIDHYTSNGWMVGKNKMKDWKAAVRTWEKNNHNSGKQKKIGPQTFNQLKIEETKKAMVDFVGGGDAGIGQDRICSTDG